MTCCFPGDGCRGTGGISSTGQSGGAGLSGFTKCCDINTPYLLVRAASLELGSLPLLLRQVESVSVFLHGWLLVLLLVGRLAFEWHPPPVDLHVGDRSKFVRIAELSGFGLEVRLVRTAALEFGRFPLVLCLGIRGSLNFEGLVGRFV